MLIVHGGPSEPYKKAWDGLRTLTNRYTFHYYDQRGCGDSTRPIDRFSTNSWSEGLPILRKKLGVEANLLDIERIRMILGQDRLILIGHSYGAFLAALYTMEFPTRVKRLVMVSPAPHIVWPIDASRDLVQIIRQHLSPESQHAYDAYNKRCWDTGKLFGRSDRELAALNREFFTFYFEYLTKIGLSHYIPLIQRLVNMDKIGGWHSFGYDLSYPDKYDWRSHYQAIRVPTLVVYGDKDIGRMSSTDYLSTIPGSRGVEIRDCGHFLFEEKPDEFAEAVGRFLDEGS